MDTCQQQNVLYHINTESGTLVYNGKKYRDFMETSNDEIYQWFHEVSLRKTNNIFNNIFDKKIDI